jgi:LysM repeat protein
MQAARPTPVPRTEIVHVVKSGEHLAEIAGRYGVRVEDIVQANGLQDANTIRAGQPLTIPLSATRR